MLRRCACNYNADATDDAECTYAADGYDCDGNCLVDSDGDGICDEFEVEGCINPEACNYVDPNLVTDLVTCVLLTQDMTAMETASLMPTVMEYATNLKLKDASMKPLATTMRTQQT